MANKDLNEIAKYEKAIKGKYGEEAIQNPKSLWTKEKESKYLKDLKTIKNKIDKKEKQEKEGFTVSKPKNKKKTERTCPVCKKYSFSIKDDTYMLRFGCCYDCYIQHIDGREERWKSGWRPND